MAFPQGIDFRATAGYVTDPTNCDPETSGGSNYPRTTAQGNTVGWTGGNSGTRDRQAGNDPRIAGMAFLTNFGSTFVDYRIDLPAAGTYTITLGAGDGGSGNAAAVELFDNTTSLGVLCSNSTVANDNFMDATNVQRTAAAWPGSNVSISATFASTICKFRVGNLNGNCCIAHVNVAASAAAAPVPYDPWPLWMPVLAQ